MWSTQKEQNFTRPCACGRAVSLVFVLWPTQTVHLSCGPLCICAAAHPIILYRDPLYNLSCGWPYNLSRGTTLFPSPPFFSHYYPLFVLWSILYLHSVSWSWEMVPTGSPSRGGDVTVYVKDINQLSLPAPFYSLFVSISVFMAFSNCISFHKFSRHLFVISVCLIT